MMVSDQLQAVANDLYLARQSRQGIPPVRTRLPEGDLAAAYAVQKLNYARWIQDGQRRVGRKIGLTSKAVQQQLRGPHPDFGALFASMDCGLTHVPTSRFIAPRIEAEIAFRIGKDITAKGLSRNELIASLDAVAPAAEICDCSIANWDVTIMDMIPDNGFASGFVIGEWTRFSADLNLVDRNMQVLRDGVEISNGIGSACLGDPVNAMAWLADAVIDYGQPLQAGEVVLSGALGPMRPMTVGTYRILIDGFTPLQVSVVD